MNVKPVNGRLLAVGAILLLGLLLVAGRLYFVQVKQAPKILATGYVDGRTLALMNRLLQQGVLLARGEGRVTVDEAALQKALPNPAQRERVRRHAQRAWLPPGGEQFDHRLFRVMSRPRLAGGQRVVRGRLLDRVGRPLAISFLPPGRGLPRRHYTLGAMAADLLGFASPIYGQRGLEAALSPILTRPDPAKPPLAAGPGGGKTRPGCDASLTVDAALQVMVAEELGERHGAIVILDVATGAILAAAGSPAFNPNQTDPAAWHAARRGHRGLVLRSRAWELTFPPGSTFKLVSAAAWLATGQPAPTVVCGKRDTRYDISDIHPTGTTDLARAVIKSSNLYFARLSELLGPLAAKTAGLLGFNQPVNLIPQLPGISLPAEPSLAFSRWQYHKLASAEGGQVARKLVPFTSFKRDYKLAAQGAIGQNLVAATPLAMAGVAQAIANGGVRRPPHLLLGFNDPEAGGRPRILSPPPGQRVISAQQAATLAGYMARVMDEGTGRAAPKVFKDGQRIYLAGKTGTAETGRAGEKPHAWFVGFAPADSPRFAVAVLLENAGRGGRIAAPAGARVLAAALGARAANKAPASLARGAIPQPGPRETRLAPRPQTRPEPRPQARPEPPREDSP